MIAIIIAITVIERAGVITTAIGTTGATGVIVIEAIATVIVTATAIVNARSHGVKRNTIRRSFSVGLRIDSRHLTQHYCA